MTDSKTYVLTSEQVLGCLLRGVALVGLVPEPTVDQAFDTIEQGLGVGATVSFVANGAVLTFAHDNAPEFVGATDVEIQQAVTGKPPKEKRPRKSRKSATPTTDPTDDTIKVLDFEDEDGEDADGIPT